MKVVEVVRKYGLEDFKKTYKNPLGNSYNLINISELSEMEVKSVNIHFPTKSAEITVIDFNH